MTDEELAVLAKGGDHGAFAELVRRYQGRLYSYLAYRGGAHAADDLFQEICVKLWTHMESYEPRGRFAGWAFTIARRTLIDYSEKEKGRRAVPLEESPEPLEGTPGPERLAEAGELSEKLQKALATLNDDQREVFLLREYGGLSFKEIAQAQGCPLGTALARMRYAVVKLRSALEGRHG